MKSKTSLQHRIKRTVSGKLIFAFVVALVVLMPESSVIAQSSVWGRPFRLSLDGQSWFPDIAADPTGRVHVVWSSDTLNYRVWDGRAWSPTSDIVIAADASGLPIMDVFRSAIAADRNGYLHLFYYHLTEGIGFYSNALVDQASGARAWTGVQAIGARGRGYYTALAVDKRNQIHAVYIDTPANSQLADVFYRRSENGGVTWSTPVNISNSSRVGSSRPQIMVDQNDTIHVSWDEGWDRRSGEGVAQTSRYVFSTSGGKEWIAPATFGSVKIPSAQLVVNSAQTPESRIAVWRSTTDEEVYYQTSSDNGGSWSGPTTIPGVLPRPWASPPFDQYTLTRDDRGIVHLILVTRRAQNSDAWALTHIEWNGKGWSRPETIFEQESLYPEYPRAAIALGNQLHVVWFTRRNLWSGGTAGEIDVWHNSKTLVNLAYTPEPSFPTATLIVPTPTIVPVSTPTRFVLAPVGTDESLPDPGFTSVIPLIIGGPAAVFVIVFALLLRRLTADHG